MKLTLISIAATPLLFAFTFPMLLSGCATGTGLKHVSKDTRVCVISQNNDVLVSENVVEPDAVNSVSKRIEKYLIRRLDERGVKTTSGPDYKPGDAKLVVKLDTIETRTSTSMGMWAPVVRAQPRIKYAATLMSYDGATLFNFEDQKDDESLDTATRKVGEAIADRTAKWFR